MLSEPHIRVVGERVQYEHGCGSCDSDRAKVSFPYDGNRR